MASVEHVSAHDQRKTQLSQAQIVFNRALSDAHREGYLLAVAEVERHIGNGLEALHAWIKSNLREP